MVMKVNKTKNVHYDNRTNAVSYVKIKFYFKIPFFHQ